MTATPEAAPYAIDEIDVASIPDQDDDAAWFEKTVEYLFVVKILTKSVSFFAPLAGDAEKAMGDLIMQNGACFRLIEFKVSKSTIRAELRKYARGKDKKVARGTHYVDYVKLLPDGDIASHPGALGHTLIFGELGDGEVDLRVLPYW